MIDALEAVLRRPKTVMMFMFLILFGGVYSYITVPKEANPDIDVPVFYISVSQQGISPEDAARLLARPLETQLQGLEGLQEMTAISAEGYAAVVLEFDVGMNKAETLADIRDKVDQAQAELPDDADEPSISETNFALQPTIIVTLSGLVPERTLFKRAKELQDKIEQIPSVLEANLKGQRDEMLEVQVDLLALESYNINPTTVVEVLDLNNRLVPAGFIDNGNGRFNVKVPGLVETGRDVFSMPLKQSGEGVVTVADVATIRRTFKDPETFTRVNGQPAISIEVVKRIGTNIIENNQAVRDVVDAETQNWSDAIQIGFLLDQSNFIYEVLGSLQSSIMTSIFLVMILVLAALGVRSGLLVGLAIPTSFMTGFLILSGMGMTVNMMVMFGLVLTVGMLVDGSIVMVEYADRKIAEGMPIQEAYIRAARLMFWPIVSSTATTLAAFMPMLLWPGVPGEFMSYLPTMVIIVLSASLLTAMVFLPVTGTLMGQFFMFVGRLALWFVHRAAWVLGLAAFVAGSLILSMVFPALIEAIPFFTLFSAPVLVDSTSGVSVEPSAAALSLLISLALVLLLLRPLFRWLRARSQSRTEIALQSTNAPQFDVKRVSGPTGLYTRLLSFVVRTPFGAPFVLAVVGGIGFATISALPSNFAGVEFFVDEEPDVAIVFVSARGNMSSREALALVTDVEAELLQVEGIDNVVAVSFPPGGASGSNSGVGGVSDKPVDLVGEINIELAKYCCRRAASEIFDEIRTRTAPLSGIKVEVRKIEGGPPTGKDLNLEIRATDYNVVHAVTSKVRAFVDTMEKLQDREDDRPLPGIEWQLKIDREEAGRFNTNVAAVGAMVQMVTNGILVDTYRPDDTDDELEMRARFPADQRTLEQLDSLRIQTSDGWVPISNFVEREAKPKVSSITRQNGMFSMNVKASLVPDSGLTPNDKVGELQSWLDSQEWPDGVFFRFRGADEEQQESGQFLVGAMVASLFIMFLILLTQYNSFWQTVITLSTVVMSVIGVLIGMMVTGQKFSIIMTGTGIIALAGIVVNNAIVLIDTYNRLKSEGDDPVTAVLQTASQRVRPILLTTITTIAGLIPMAAQVNFDFFNQTISVGGITAIWWVQLSTAIISGLAFATILTLFVVPTLLVAPYVYANSFARGSRLAQHVGATLVALPGHGFKVLRGGQKSLPTKRHDGEDDGPSGGLMQQPAE